MKIFCSAIKQDGIIYPGKRHHNCIATIAEITGELVNGEQGFIDDSGNFYDRKRARILAEKAGQLLERASKGDKLFSEDIY